MNGRRFSTRPAFSFGEAAVLMGGINLRLVKNTLLELGIAILVRKMRC